MEKKTMKNNIVLIIIALIIVACFAYLSNRSKSSAERPAVLTAVQSVLARDMNTNYPPTPKEVLKYYSEITRCFYGETYTEEELLELAEKSRELFDEELVANQTDEEYFQSLRRTIASYKKEKRSISSYSVSSSANVKYYNYEGAQWATLNCIYSMKTENTIVPSQEEFLFRKDAEGRWKIFGWQLVENEENANE